MKRFVTAAIAFGLLLNAANTDLLAQGKGKGGPGQGKQTGPQPGGKGKQTGPQDGSGKQQGKGQKGKQTGPQDGTGPIHTPTPTK